MADVGSIGKVSDVDRHLSTRVYVYPPQGKPSDVDRRFTARSWSFPPTQKLADKDYHVVLRALTPSYGGHAADMDYKKRVWPWTNLKGGVISCKDRTRRMWPWTNLKGGVASDVDRRATIVHATAAPHLGLNLYVSYGVSAPSCPLTLLVGLHGRNKANILTLTLKVGAGSTVGFQLLLTLQVRATGAPSLPLVLSVQRATLAPTLYLSLVVQDTSAPSLPLLLTVTSDVLGRSAHWSVAVTIDGVDVSSSLTGTLHIEVEEGMARIASIELLAPAGNLDPVVYTALNPTTRSRPLVNISYSSCDSSGATLYSVLAFTGIVGTPDFDPTRKVLTLHCTDDRQNILANTPTDTLASLIGGYWSEAALGTPLDNFEYAEKRMTTVPASLDLSVHRSPRVTPWLPKVTPDFTLTGTNDMIEGLIEVKLSERTKLRNFVRITAQYRCPILRNRVVKVAWAMGEREGIWKDMIWPVPYPTGQVCADAILGTGWDVAFSNTGLINTYSVNGWFIPSYSHALPQDFIKGITLTYLTNDLYVAPLQKRVSSFTVKFRKRYVQQSTETYDINVLSPGSISVVGVMPDVKSASLDAKFDVQAWESNPLSAPIIPDPKSFGETAIYGDTASIGGRADADAMLQASISAAQVVILKTHRLNTVRFQLQASPLLDVTHTVSVSGRGIAAQGKVRKITHEFDLASGKAVSQVEMAVSRGYETEHGVFGVAENVRYTVPAASPYTVTVSPPDGGYYVTDVEVIETGQVVDPNTGIVTQVAASSTMSRVAVTPQAGQYVADPNTGQYTFSADDTNHVVLISYEYATASPSGPSPPTDSPVQPAPPTILYSYAEDDVNKSEGTYWLQSGTTVPSTGPFAGMQTEEPPYVPSLEGGTHYNVNNTVTVSCTDGLLHTYRVTGAGTTVNSTALGQPTFTGNSGEVVTDGTCTLKEVGRVDQRAGWIIVAQSYTQNVTAPDPKLLADGWSIANSQGLQVQLQWTSQMRLIVGPMARQAIEPVIPASYNVLVPDDALTITA
jgi:hypothetical protein